MLENCPSTEALTEKIMEIMDENVEINGELIPNVPLMAELGMDSLDMIETSFSLQEFFEFEFSDKNALEELEKELKDGSVIAEGVLTEFGLDMVRKRMPELADVVFPENLTAMRLQEYYTVETFSRMIREFYLAAPEVCPETSEAVVVRDFKLVTAASGVEIKAPTGDALVDAWVKEVAAELSQKVSS